MLASRILSAASSIVAVDSMVRTSSTITSFTWFLSAFFRGFRMGLFAWPAAAIVFAGALLGLPSVGPLSGNWLALAGCSALALLGFLFGRQPVE